MTKTINLITLFFILSFSLILAGGVFLLSFWAKLPPQLPWLYSLPWGEGQLIPKLWFGLGLLILVVVSLINYFICLRLEKKDFVMGLVVAGGSLLFVILYLASFIRVLSLMI